MKQFVLDVAGLSDRGIKRDHNEDAWFSPRPDLTPSQTESKGQLYIVADGVGGHLAGDVASNMAVEVIHQHYYADPSPDVPTGLAAAIEAANAKIDQEATAKLERRGMGTTVTAAVLRGNELTVANVGDSRTYLIRQGHARQITSDHTWVEEQVQFGLITREEATNHPQRNIITRSLGGSPELALDFFEERVEEGDAIFLCSDGVTNLITDQEIAAIVGRRRKAKTSVRELIELAKQRGAPDNVTAILLNISGPSSRGLRRLLVTAVILGGLALVTGGVALGALVRDSENEKPTAAGPTIESGTTPAPSVPTTPLATLAPLHVTIPAPELVWPAENTSVVAGDHYTFVWNWEGDLGQQDGRFLFVLQTSEDTVPLVSEEVPLNQRRFVISQPLDAGGYLWTMSVSGSEMRGASAGRLFVVIEPTSTPIRSPTLTPDNAD